MPRANYSLKVHITSTRKWRGKVACNSWKFLYKHNFVMAATAQRWLDLDRPDAKKLCKFCMNKLKLKPQPVVVIEVYICSLCINHAVIAYGKGGCPKHGKRGLHPTSKVGTWEIYMNQKPKRRRK